MKFNAYRNLVESYDVSDELIYEVLRLVKSVLSNKHSTRGNGVLCEFLCSLYTHKTGTPVSPADYAIHHIDGNHDNNNFNNIALIRNTVITPIVTVGGRNNGNKISHISIHFDAARSAISRFCYDNYNLNTGTVLDKRMLSGLCGADYYEIVSNYLYYIKMVAERKSSRASNLDIIFVKNFI